MTYKITSVNDHILINSEEGRLLVDTGCPTSFCNGGRITLCGNTETVPESLMCKEFSAIGIKGPEYHIDAFIMRATVCARILDDIEKKTTFIGQEKGKKTSLH